MPRVWPKKEKKKKKVFPDALGGKVFVSLLCVQFHCRNGHVFDSGALPGPPWCVTSTQHIPNITFCSLKNSGFSNEPGPRLRIRACGPGEVRVPASLLGALLSPLLGPWVAGVHWRKCSDLSEVSRLLTTSLRVPAPPAGIGSPQDHRVWCPHSFPTHIIYNADL